MIEQFESCLKNVNYYLKFLGLCLNKEDTNRTMFQRMGSHRIFTAHCITFNLEVLAEILWVIEAVITGKSFLEIIYFVPCLILCLISNFKTFSFLCYAHYVNEFTDAINEMGLDSMRADAGQKEKVIKKNLLDEHVALLTNISMKVLYLAVMGVLMFSLCPLFIILPRYYSTGEWKLELPFIAYYPFNEFDVRIYPWIYIHQVWTAMEAVLMVCAPDCFFFTCCSFVHINFLFLKYDIQRIVTDENQQYDQVKFKKIVLRHIELMRCVNLLEKIFSKSILFNALTSSVIICVTGFNVMVVTNLVIMASFTAFLIFALLQIFLYCYYGDMIMRSSLEISDAIYNSQWYNISAADRKGIFIVLLRAQKPCELTAYGFFKINLRAFTSILSTSWSYFALLKTMYHPE